MTDKTSGNMTIHLPVKLAQVVEKHGEQFLKVECSAIEFFQQAMSSELISECINDITTKKFLCKIIGIDMLEECYDSELLLDHIGSEKIKKYIEESLNKPCEFRKVP